MMKNLIQNLPDGILPQITIGSETHFLRNLFPGHIYLILVTFRELKGTPKWYDKLRPAVVAINTYGDYLADTFVVSICVSLQAQIQTLFAVILARGVEDGKIHLTKIVRVMAKSIEEELLQLVASRPGEFGRTLVAAREKCGQCLRIILVD